MEDTMIQLSHDTDLIQIVITAFFKIGGNNLLGERKQEITDSWKRIQALSIIGWMTQEKIIQITENKE